MLIRKPKGRLTKSYLDTLKEAVNHIDNPVRYLAIDPGKANGVCGYDSSCQLMFMMTISSEDINLFIHQFNNVQYCIIEGFSLFPNKAKQQIYSDMETPRVIGRVESWAEIKEVELVKQPPNIKPTGYKWIGEKPLPKSNPINHQMDAHVHAMYYFIVTGKVKLEEILKK